MRNIDIARIRDYGLKELLQHKITSTSSYLTKNGYQRKSLKSELVQVLRTYLPEVPSRVSCSEIPSVLLIDFVAYCRKVPLRKLLVKTYRYLLRDLWPTQGLSSLLEQTDIIFDLYLVRSIKKDELKRRIQDGVVETTILQLKQSFPVEMEKF